MSLCICVRECKCELNNQESTPGRILALTSSALNRFIKICTF